VVGDVRYDRIAPDLFALAGELEIDHDMLIKEFRAECEATIGCFAVMPPCEVN
jgi:hypothetical protein